VLYRQKGLKEKGNIKKTGACKKLQGGYLGEQIQGRIWNGMLGSISGQSTKGEARSLKKLGAKTKKTSRVIRKLFGQGRDRKKRECYSCNKNKVSVL